MYVPELPFQEVGSFIAILFQCVNSSLSSVNVSTGVPCEPKELILDFKGLAVMVVTRVSYGINAEGEGYWVVVVNGGSGWYGVVVGHKRISITDKLVIG